MAYFAKLGVGDIVEGVTSVSDDIAISEQAGADFLNTTFQTNDVWKQCYLGGIEGGYAGIGYSYDRESNLFTAPKKPFVEIVPGVDVPVRDRG